MVEKMFLPASKQVFDSGSRFQVGLLLTLDVEEDGLALDDVGVGGDAVADPAAVVSPRSLLNALQPRFCLSPHSQQLILAQMKAH